MSALLGNLYVINIICNLSSLWTGKLPVDQGVNAVILIQCVWSH